MATYLKFLVGLGALTVSTQTAASLNVPIATRVISFLQPSPIGAISAAILFQPGNAASEAEAAMMERSIAGGLVVGKASLRARRVSIATMGTLSGFRVAFVTAGLRDDHAAIAAAAARSSVLTISSDPTCVQAARCVVGIVAAPKVQITVSRAAARSANIRFGSAFLMLVREI